MKILNIFLIKEIIYPIIIILVSLMIYAVVKRCTIKIFNVKVKKIDIKKRNTACGLIINVEKYFVMIVAFLMILGIYGVDTVTLVTSLGVAGIAAGLAIQDTLKDFVSGISIIFENKYCVGDNITVSNFRGEVIELGMKTTKVKAYTGEVLILPNHIVDKVINHSVDKYLAIVDIDVSYEMNLDEIEKVLEELCETLTYKLSNLKGEVQLLGINEFSASSIKYRIVADTMAMENYSVERQIRKEIKLCFDKNEIDIPYNQVVLHNAK